MTACRELPRQVRRLVSQDKSDSPLRIQRNGDACGSAATRAAALAERYWHRRIRAQSVTGGKVTGGKTLPEGR